MGAAAAAHAQAEFVFERRQAALERAEHAGGDAGGVPVHAHDGAERLEPEGVREAAQELFASVVMHDRFAQDAPEAGHALPEPVRHAAAVQGQVGASRALTHAAEHSAAGAARTRGEARGR